MKKEKINLNLGCYGKKLPDFVNVDIRKEANPDIVDNAFTLKKFKNESVDLIYCSHMLEHLDFKEADEAIKRWYQLLKKDGVLRIAVPDMKSAFAHYFYWGDLKLLYSNLWGSQRHEFDYHKSGYDEITLTEKLLSIGFKKVKKWDWQTTYPHNYIDDYSQAYYPDFHKKNKLANGKTADLGGKLMSLNLEAIK
jgi:predicted SAM-dependent methyltransferase